MSVLVQEHDPFQAMLEALFQNDPQDPLFKIRQKAWTRLQEIGLPTRQTENYKYVNLRKLYTQTFFKPELFEIKDASFDNSLVFVNGRFVPHLSTVKNDGLIVSTLNNAIHTYGSFLVHRWTSSLADEQDSFVLANTAFHQEGAFIYLPPKTVIKEPINIINIIHAENNLWVAPRIHLFAGSSSQIDLIFKTRSVGINSYLFNPVIDLTLEDNAGVRCTMDNTHFSEENWIFEATRATLKRNSTLKTVSAVTNTCSTRQDYHVKLMGENAEALLNGIWAMCDKSEAHTHILIDHQAPSCRSMQLFKGVLKDFSKSSFEGKILVRQPAQKTDAFQLNNNLLLNEGTHADTKPNLEIFADDVKASHGATVGQLDDEQLFYMLARGLKRSFAEKLLVQGFCQEVLDLIHHNDLKEEISHRCLKSIS